MGGGLEHPAGRGPVPLQGLEHGGATRRWESGPGAAPHGVLGDVVEAGEHVAGELVGEGEDALGGEVAAVLVHGGEGGDHLVHERDLVVAQRRPEASSSGTVWRSSHSSGGRLSGSQASSSCSRVVPERPSPVTTIGRVTGSAAMAGSLLPEVHQAQPVLQDQLELAPGPEAPGQVELAPRSSREAQSRRRAPPTSVAEVVEPGGHAWRRRAGPRVAARRWSVRRRRVPRPRATSFSVHGLRAGGVQGTGCNRTRQEERGENGSVTPPSMHRRPGDRAGARGGGASTRISITPSRRRRAAHMLGCGIISPPSSSDHALQTASRCSARAIPDDDELAVAGLVHDIGHLLPGGSDENTPSGGGRGAAVVGGAGGGLVGLHVEAKRYLVASEAAYGGVLSAESVISLGCRAARCRTASGRFEALPLVVRRPGPAPSRRQGEGRGSRGCDSTSWVPSAIQWLRRPGVAVV